MREFRQEVYEVEREDYMDFWKRLKKDKIKVDSDAGKNEKDVEHCFIRDLATNEILAEQTYDPITEIPHYYIYELEYENMEPPKPHVNVELTEEETKEFFRLLGEAVKEQAQKKGVKSNG